MAPARPRALLALVALAAVLLPALAAGADETVCVVRRRVVERPDRWTEVAALPFAGPGASEVTGYAVSPTDPDLVYVTNGRTVLRTRDGGCSWVEVWRAETVEVGQVVLTPRDQRVVDLAIPALDAGGLVLLLDEANPATRLPKVLVSHDQGRTFAESLAGLPVGGEARRLAPSLRAGTLYASVTVGAATDVYRSADDGRTWTRRGAFPGGAPSALRVDPRSGDRLWAVVAGTLHRSDDAGASFRPVAVPGPIGGLAVAPVGGTTRVVAGRVDRPVLFVSDDGGGTWEARYAVHAAQSAALAAGRGLAAVAGPLGVAVVDPRADVTYDVSPSVAVEGLSVSEPPGGPPVLYVRTARSLLRLRVLPREENRPRRVSPPVDIGEVPDVAHPVPALEPDVASLTVDPGERETLDLVLDLPPTPTPLDVAFLVDTTGSMQSAIDGLRSDIDDVVHELAASGIDARFGLAEFRDYPGYGEALDVPYRLLRPIGPADDDLESAIERLDAGGGGDTPESTLTALHQAVTGAGERYAGQQLVPRGDDMGFRPGSLRVAVVATDAEFHQEPGYPGPSFDRVAAVLRRAGVHQVGLSVLGGGRDDLEDMASATGTLSPAEGVDCDGDGRVDIDPGLPLVCDVTWFMPGTRAPDGAGRLDLAPAILGLLRALRDEVAVDLVPTGPAVARVLPPAAYPSVNVKAANTLAFRVEVSCPADLRGRTVRTDLGARRRGETVASSALTVLCRAAPAAVAAPAAQYQPPPPRPPAAAVAAPPVPAPPAPVPNAQPQPQPNAHPNPQAQPHPQAGLVAQEETRPQVAVAGEDVPAGEELAMSALAREEDDGAAAALLAGAAAACAGLAGAAAHRRRAAAAYARAGRR